MKTLGYRTLPTLYTLTVFACCFFVSCKEEFDYTVDTANPTVISFNPVSGVEGVAINSNLILTFDEHVKKGKGNITISSESDTRTIDVTSETVTIGSDARIVTIDPEDFNADEEYTVKLDRGVFTDLLDNEFMGIPENLSWKFTTAGEDGLQVLSLTPENASTDGSLFKLEMTFASGIKKGQGSITVYRTGDEKVAEIPVASQSVVVGEQRMVINLDAPLEFASDYYVNIDAGAIVSIDGKEFKGFRDASSWAFTTTSGSGSELIVHLPMDGDLTDASGNKFDASPGEYATAKIEFIEDGVRGKVARFVSGSYAVLPKHNLLRPTLDQDFSFNLWVKLKGIGSDPVLFANSDWDSGSNPGFILCTDGGDTYDASGSGRGWLLKVAGKAESSNRMDWRAGEATPQAPALSDDQWHMVTVVLNQTTKRLHVYIDGIAYNNDGNPNSYDLNTLLGPMWDEANDYPFTIWEDGTGRYNAGSETRKALAGLMDDLSVYQKALTPAEVTDLYTK